MSLACLLFFSCQKAVSHWLVILQSWSLIGFTQHTYRSMLRSVPLLRISWGLSDVDTSRLCPNLIHLIYKRLFGEQFMYCSHFALVHCRFGQGLKIIHFIGAAKPWLQPFNTETSLVQVSGESHHIREFVQFWWDMFCTRVHPSLSSEMVCYSHTRIYSLLQLTSSKRFCQFILWTRGRRNSETGKFLTRIKSQ